MCAELTAVFGPRAMPKYVERAGDADDVTTPRRLLLKPRTEGWRRYGMGAGKTN
jgi:hypothetical protein